MGVDYKSVAGYGVKVKECNLTEEGLSILENTYDGEMYAFIEGELGIEPDTIGSEYSEETTYCIILKNPIENNTLDKFNKFQEDLNKYDKLIKDTKLSWINELYIY